MIITEIGGAVGDIESLPFLEAIRQARLEFGYDRTLYIHNTLVPFLKSSEEIKTKPTQHSVKELSSLGIQPDIIILRSEVPVPLASKEKLLSSAMFLKRRFLNRAMSRFSMRWLLAFKSKAWMILF